MLCLEETTMPYAICTGKKQNIDDDALVNFTITQ